jgi:glycosyltransferase involved in cell wall biosynthesis
MLKVLVLSEMFPNPDNATAGIFVLEQMRALRRQGVEFRVISPTPWIPPGLRSVARLRKYAASPAHGTVDGFAVDYLRIPMFPRGAFLYLAGFVYYLWCRALLREMLKETSIDLIHAHAIAPAGFGAVLLGREFKIPVICTVHGSDINVQPWRNRGNLWATKWALARVDRLCAVSQSLADKVRELADGLQVDLVRNGADPEAFRAGSKSEARAQLGVPLADQVLLFVGNLIAIKNVAALLEAMAQLPRKDINLCLVGDGELRESLERMAADLGIRDRCIFAGRRPHEEIPLWLSAADCLVISSQMEGFPTIIPEAMLCGIPIIATAVGGIPEVVVDGVTGLLIAPGDTLALAEAMTALLNQPGLATGLAKRAENFACQNLTWESNARQVMSLYEETLNRPSPVPVLHV